MKTVKNAWVFDVDGVITDPQKKEITEPEILEEIVKRLERGGTVALNTGRSLSWLLDRVVNPLLQKTTDLKKLANNLFAVGEFGGTWLSINEDGTTKQHIDDSIVIPQFLRQQVKTLIENGYLDSMFYDDSKITMITTEMKDGYSIDKYRKYQKELINELSDLVKSNNLSKEFVIHYDIIATNIMSKKVSKRFAVERIMKWLKEINTQPEKFITFGDSTSDIPMAEQIDSLEFPVEFVYVGKENINPSRYPFPIRQTRNKFEKGTLEFLKSL